MHVSALVLIASGLPVICILAEFALTVWERLDAANVRGGRLEMRPDQSIRFPAPHIKPSIASTDFKWSACELHTGQMVSRGNGEGFSRPLVGGTSWEVHPQTRPPGRSGQRTADRFQAI